MSSTVLVCYVIQGDEDSPETGVQSSFRVERPSAPRALTLFRLRELFPFEGTFHFRLRIPDDSGLADFCWVDLTNDGDNILELAENLGGLEGGKNGEPRQQRIHLKVLPLDFGTPVEEDVPVGGTTAVPPPATPPPPPPSAAAPPPPAGGGVFSIGEGGGMAHGSPRVAVDSTEDDDLAGGVSGLDLGGGQSFDVGGSDGESDTPSVGRTFDDGHRGEERFDAGGSGRGGGGGVGVGGDYGERGWREEGGRGDGGEMNDGQRYRGARAPGDDDDEDDADWKASVVNQASQGVKDLQKKTSQVAKTMGFGAKKMWNAINKGVGGPVIPSEEALENLHELANFLATPFSPTNPEHIKDLGKVWGCLFPDDEFEGVESPRWQEAGFQEDNVAVDFRGTGVLALKSMVFFCQNYEHKALALCRAQSRGTPSHYPWAVVANNLTLMLAEVLELRADQYAGSRKGYWGVFDRRGAYFEVFCMAFRLLDHTWTERGAKRSNFGQIIGYTKSVVVDLLDSNPPNLPAFMGQAEEMGMLR